MADIQNTLVLWACIGSSDLFCGARTRIRYSLFGTYGSRAFLLKRRAIVRDTSGTESRPRDSTSGAKRAGRYWFDLTADRALVLGKVMDELDVAEKPEMLFTALRRCARAVGRVKRLGMIKTSTKITTGATKTHFTLPLFILVTR